MCSPWGVEVELEGSSAEGAACAPADMAALRRITCSIIRKLSDRPSKGLSEVLRQGPILTAGETLPFPSTTWQHVALYLMDGCSGQRLDMRMLAPVTQKQDRQFC